MGLKVLSLLISAFAHVGQVPADYGALMRRVDFSHLITFVGISAYSVEGINLLFSLRRDYIKHRTKESFRALYYSCYFGVIALYIIFGTFNYLKFGFDTKRIIFFNYGPESSYIFVLQIMYAVVGLSGALYREPPQPVPGLQHRVQLRVL